MRLFHTIITGLALFAATPAMATPATASPDSDYAAIEGEFEGWLLANNPEYASVLGKPGFEGKIRDIRLTTRDKQAAEAKAFLARLEKLPDVQLSPANRTSKAILIRWLRDDVAANSFGQRTMLFSTYDGWHQGFVGLADGSPFRNAADYRSYLDRLKQYPALNAAALDISTQAVKAGYVLPCTVLTNSEASIRGVIAATPEKSRFYEPFLRKKPNDVDDASWSAMKVEAAGLIRDVLNPEYARHADWFARTYLPKCSKAVGISAQPGGTAYYKFRIAQETTTNLDADAIHKIGLSEVARIAKAMDETAKAAGFADRKAYYQELKSNPKYFAKTPEELMEKTARITRAIDAKLPSLFGTLPRLPYTIREIPAEIAPGTTTAYYNSGSQSAGTAGTYYVNTSKLDQRPLWEIPALSVHEAMPGHHLQIALQQEMALPMWRRHFTGFTAFVEGWGLYSEGLGIDMGLYDTPEKMMGRHSYEMWRAARLVVDTGLHSKGWTKQQAIDFMKDYTGLTDANIEAEVNRYISWPGQALGYKIGELKIRELRAEAEKTLGPKFDIRAFHDVVLGQGAVPLDVLEAQVRAWIAKTKGTR
jgi:uncharacterized protein (DUF885 family)